MSFAMDLVRLSASAEFASEIIPDCELTLSEICEVVRDGYIAGLEGAGEPFVLERRHAWLLRLVRSILKEPKRFWKAWLQDKTQLVAHERVPQSLAILLREALPAEAEIQFREMKPGVTKGLGSLGHDRFFSYAEHQGGPMAAEGKSVALSAAVWATGQTNGEIRMEKLLRPEARPFSPGTMIRNGWLIRPLMSDCGQPDRSPLNLDQDPTAGNPYQDPFLTATGCGTPTLQPRTAPPTHLQRRNSETLIPTFRKTTETMIDLIRTDYKT